METWRSLVSRRPAKTRPSFIGCVGSNPTVSAVPEWEPDLSLVHGTPLIMLVPPNLLEREGSLHDP